MNEPQIGDRLQFPDGDFATITRMKEYKDEEGSQGFYDAIEIWFTMDGDDSGQEFNELLDSRDGYAYHIMKPIK